MIRKHTPKDLDTIMNIWQKASSLAHPFLDATFVEKVSHDMRTMYIPGSETWVFEEDSTIVGFISMIENEIGGLFVMPSYQSKGIGTKLVHFIKGFHEELEVEVFVRNATGRAFYDKYGFKLIKTFMHTPSNNEVMRLKYK